MVHGAGGPSAKRLTAIDTIPPACHVRPMSLYRLIVLLSVLVAAAIAPRLGLSDSKVPSGALRVAVLDTGLDLSDPRLSARLCALGHRSYTGDGLADTNGHGTHVVSTIERYAGSQAPQAYCLVVYKVFGGDAAMNRVIGTAIHDAVEDGADIINLSFGGTDYSQWEYAAIASAPGVRFVAAAGNDGKELGAHGYSYYPASYRLPNVLVVGALDKRGARNGYSNYGHLVTAWELGDVLGAALGGGTITMSGTSMATAVETGLLIKRLLR